MFEKVNYTFYSDTLCRAVIPNEDLFEKYAFENRLYVKSLIDDGLLQEREEDGIDSAVCLMSEIDYITAVQTGKEEDENGICAQSENIGGYSYSADATTKSKSLELNEKSADAQKYKILRLFCIVQTGVR